MSNDGHDELLEGMWDMFPGIDPDYFCRAFCRFQRIMERELQRHRAEFCQQLRLHRRQWLERLQRVSTS